MSDFHFHRKLRIKYTVFRNTGRILFISEKVVEEVVTYFQKLGRKWNKMSKKLRKTFSRPESDKTETDIKEPVEASVEIPSEATIELAIKKELEEFTEKPVTKASTKKPSKKSKPTKVEAKAEPKVEPGIKQKVEPKVKSKVESKVEHDSAVDVDHIEFVEKKSSKKKLKEIPGSKNSSVAKLASQSVASLKTEVANQKKEIEKEQGELKMLSKQLAKEEKELANQKTEFKELKLQVGIHGQKSDFLITGENQIFNHLSYQSGPNTVRGFLVTGKQTRS